MSGFIELRQTSENNWKARYQGNYGTYIIKVTMDGKKAVKFLCTCPSDYYPCKHISYIEDEIIKQIAFAKKRGEDKSGHVKVVDLIKNVSVEKLREFISVQAQYNDDVLNAVFLEFGTNIEEKKGNKYSRIIRQALGSIDLYQYEDDDYQYDDNFEDSQEIEILDQWFDKAWNLIDKKQYDEALLIAKACIEEYSKWLCSISEYIANLFSSEYQSIPFDIIKAASEYINKKELLDYCRLEMKKEKYVDTDFYDCFEFILA